MKYLLLAGLAFIVSSCAANSGPSFVNMSEMEIMAYNRGMPPEKQVYCVQEADTSSFIRRRICRSYEDWITHNEQSVMTLDVLHAPPSFGLPSSIP